MGGLPHQIRSAIDSSNIINSSGCSENLSISFRKYPLDVTVSDSIDLAQEFVRSFPRQDFLIGFYRFTVRIHISYGWIPFSFHLPKCFCTFWKCTSTNIALYSAMSRDPYYTLLMLFRKFVNPLLLVENNTVLDITVSDSIDSAQEFASFCPYQCSP